MSEPISNIFSNAGCLLYFAEGCTEQERADVQDTILYTQLSADKSYSRFSQTGEWSIRQREAMHRFGWALSQKDECSLPFADLSKGSLRDGMQGRLPSFVSVEEAERLWAAANDCHQHDPDQPGWRSYAKHVYGPQARAVNRVMLQLGMLEPGAVLSMTSITFSSRRSSFADLPFTTLSTTDVVGNVTFATYRWQLSETVYALSRAAISQKLASHREGLVFPLQSREHEQPEPPLEVTQP